MARKLNKTIVGVLILTGMVLMAVSGFILVANLQGRDPAEYRADAEVLEQEGEFERALQMYKRAYAKDPAKDPGLLVAGARCAVELEGGLGDAMSLIQMAQVEDPDHQPAAELALDLSFELAQAASSPARWTRAMEAAEKLVEIDPQSSRGQHVLGMCYLRRSGEDSTYPDLAEAALRRALELDPTNLDAVRVLAEIYLGRASEYKRKRQTSELRKSRDTLNQLIAQSEQHIDELGDTSKKTDLNVMRARIELSRDTRDGSGGLLGIKMLEDIAKSAPDNVGCFLFLGSFYSSRGPGMGDDPAKAESYYDKAIEVAPADARAYLALGSLYPSLGKGGQCAELYERGLKEIKFERHFRSLLGNWYRAQLLSRLCEIDLASARQAKGEQSNELLSSAESRLEMVRTERGPSSWRAILMEAQILSVRGEFVEALRGAEKADRLVGGTNVFEIKVLLGDLYARQGEWGAAERALRAAHGAKKGSLSVYWSLCNVLLRLDRPAEVIRLLKPDGPPVLRKALLEDSTCARLRLAAYQALKQFEAAAAENALLSSRGDDDGGSQLRQASLLITQERYDEAERLIVHDPTGGQTALLEQDPVNLDSVNIALYLFQVTDRRESAVDLVRSLVERYPDERIYRRYEFSLRNQSAGGLDDETAEAFFAGETDPFAREMGRYGWYSSRRQYEKARQCLDEAEALRGDDSGVLERQFGLALTMKDFDRAERYAERQAKLNTDGTEGRFYHGRLAAARGDYETAIKHMRSALEAYPSNSRGHALLAEAYKRAGRRSQAKTQLRRSLDLDPTSGLANRMMAQIAASEGDVEALERFVRAAARTLGSDPWVRRQLQLLDEKDNPEEGITKREKARKKNPGDVENLVLLARLYKETGDYDESAEVYRAALEAAKSNPDVNDIMVTREVAWSLGGPEMNRLAEGEALLQALQREKEDPADKALVTMFLARFYERQGRISSAERQIRTAVSFDDSAEVLLGAAEFFNRITRLPDALAFLDRALPKVDEQADLIRGRIISILLSTGDMDRAAREVAAFRRDYPDSPDGLIYEGTYHLLGGDIEKAEAAFQAELERRPESAVALWQRGQLFALKGQWQAAIADLQRAKVYRPNGFGYLHRIALSEALRRAGRSDDAILELQLIIQEHPEQSDAAFELVTAYLQVRPPRFEEAEHLIHTYMRDWPRDARWPSRLGSAAAGVREWDKAVDAFKHAAKIGRYAPGFVTALYEVYRVSGRPEDALRYAETELSEARLASMPKVLATLGWANAETGHEADALTMYDRALVAALSGFSDQAAILVEMTRILGQEAVRAWIDSREAPPLQNRRILVLVLYLGRDLAGAEAAAKGVLADAKGDDDRIFAQVALASIYSDTARHEDARRAYEAVIEYDPRHFLALNNLAFLLSENLGQPKEALPYAKEAARLAPNNADVLDTLGWILHLNRRLGEASLRLLQSLRLDPDNIAASYHLGLVYKDQGYSKEARSALDQAKDAVESQLKFVEGQRAEALRRYLPKIDEAMQGLE